MRAWWSMLLVPNMEANFLNICACSLLCLDEPTQNTASGPLSLRIARSLSPISAPSADAARKSGLTACAAPSDLRVSSMAASSDFGGLVVLQDMRGGTVCRGLRIGRRRLGRGELHLVAGSRDGRDGSGASQSRGEQEFTAGGRLGGFYRGPPHCENLGFVELKRFAFERERGRAG